MRVREGGYLKADLDARRVRLGGALRSGRGGRRAGHQRPAGAAARARARAARRGARRRGARRAGDRQVRRPVGHHRGGGAVPRPPRPLAGADGIARALRPQARLPAPGDEPRGQHGRLEGRRAGGLRGHRRRSRPSSRRCASRSRMSSDEPNRRGLLFVVSAPSGTGKTTVVERLVQVTPGLALSRSYTSRQRPGGRNRRHRL